MDYIVNIKRFAVHDGDGIRTTVFFKGCPLACKWCHNPEAIFPAPVLGFYRHKCTLCGSCAAVCACHKITNGQHTLDRTACVLCGNCVSVCPQEALTLYGKPFDLEEVTALLLEDKAFYDASGGGVTVSGGEPLLHPEAVYTLFSRMKDSGIHTAVDTCCFVPHASLHRVLPVTDVLLCDLKLMDAQKHREWTGQDNSLILENIRYLDDQGKSIEIRIPLIPSVNDDPASLDAAGLFLQTLGHVTKIRLLPYHDYASTKYEALGLTYPMPKDIHPPEEEHLQTCVERLRAFHLPAVSGKE